jgi:hypothetical protein
VIEDLFDGPNNFTVQNIYTPFGYYHEGFGLLMAADGWASYNATTNPEGLKGGPCTFSTASNLENVPCPQNLLVSFSGPGSFGGVGLTTNPNSTFISVYGVPEDLTTVYVQGEWPDNWVNSWTPQLYLYSQSPNFSKGALVQSPTTGKLVPLPNYASYIPTPIQSITYGITQLTSSSPVTIPLPAGEPIQGDVPVINPLVSTGCPLPTPTSPNTVPNFSAPAQNLVFTADGQYQLHYYAQDCAGTQELLFTQAPGTGSWMTNFYTYQINVDTQKPTIALVPNSKVSPSLQLTQGGSYTKGSKVIATLTCTDPNTVVNHLNTGSGVVLCGTSIYGPQSTYGTTVTVPMNTSTNAKGTQTLSTTFYAIDGAGNTTSLPVTYSVH